MARSLSIRRRAAEAEDLAQGAFLKVLNAAARYEPTATFRTYFYRVLMRLCLDHRRKKRPRLADPLPNTPDIASSPSAQADQAERDALIQAALNSLTVAGDDCRGRGTAPAGNVERIRLACSVSAVVEEAMAVLPRNRSPGREGRLPGGSAISVVIFASGVAS